MTVSKMKVRDVRTKKKRDAYYTLIPLNFVLRLVGLSCIYRDGGILRVDWSFRKIVFLIFFFGVLNVYNVYTKMVFWNQAISYSFQDFVQLMFLIGYFQYISDLYLVHKYGRDQFLHYLSVYDHIDKVLGMTYYKEVRRSIINVIVIFPAISIISSLADFFAWIFTLQGPYNLSLATYIIDYIYVILRSFSFADVIAHVSQVSYRLKVIGDSLKDFYFLNETAPGVKDVIVEKDAIRKSLNKIQKSRPMKTVDQHELLIQKFEGCYLMILEQCDYINSMFGVRIIGTWFTSFVDMIVLLNMFLRILIGSLDSILIPEVSIFPAISSMIRLSSCIFMLSYEVFKCEQGYNQITRIIRYIDLLLINKKIPVSTQENLKNFRALLLSRPLKFHAVNFYKLDSALLLSALSAVHTYTIIMLQNLR